VWLAKGRVDSHVTVRRCIAKRTTEVICEPIVAGNIARTDRVPLHAIAAVAKADVAGHGQDRGTICFDAKPRPTIVAGRIICDSTLYKLSPQLDAVKPTVGDNVRSNARSQIRLSTDSDIAAPHDAIALNVY
jgi:hypothetical protein